MFFYLIQNSTLIEKELDEKSKIIKVFLYGGIAYIVLHATLFIGGEDALLYNLKNYFWLFFILDVLTLFLINNNNINLDDLLKNFKNKMVSKPIIKPQNRFIKTEKRPSKKVTFEVPTYDYSSDSESDIGTDVDFDEFRRTLNL